MLPDLPGVVHGIVSLDPPQVQCDGCGLVVTGENGQLAFTVIQCRIEFNTSAELPGVRMCYPCWGEAGWVETHYGWRKIQEKS